jgi:hypothetical protein
LLIGAVMALAVMRTIASLLFELTPFDLSTFAQVLIAVGVVSALACAAPIARTRKDVSWIVTE